MVKKPSPPLARVFSEGDPACICISLVSRLYITEVLVLPPPVLFSGLCFCWLPIFVDIYSVLKLSHPIPWTGGSDHWHAGRSGLMLLLYVFRFKYGCISMQRYWSSLLRCCPRDRFLLAAELRRHPTLYYLICGVFSFLFPAREREAHLWGWHQEAGAGGSTLYTHTYTHIYIHIHE